MKKLLLLPFLLLFVGCNNSQDKNIAAVGKLIHTKETQKENLKNREKNTTMEQNRTNKSNEKINEESNRTVESEVSKEEWIVIQKENEIQEKMLKEIVHKEKENMQAVEQNTTEVK